MSFAFKRYNFFQPHQFPRHGFPPNASCVVPGGPLLWVGTESGSVCVLDSRLCHIGSFNAHGHKVLEVIWLERRQLLVTVGVEEPGCSSTTVKLWSGEKLGAAVAAAESGNGGTGAGGGASALAASAGPNSPASIAASMSALKTTKVFGYHSGQQYPESPVTAAAAVEGGGAASSNDSITISNGAGSLGGGGGGGGAAGAAGGSNSHSSGGAVESAPTPLTVALGLASGSVVVLVGEVHAGPAGGGLPRVKLHHSRRLSARPDEGDLLAINGLELTGTSDLMSLFVVTESQTLCFHLQTNTKTVLDPQGCSAPRCCCLRPGGSMLTVARSEGLYDYTADTRAGCTAFEGTKQRLTCFGRYLVVVTRDDSAAAASSAASNPLSGGAGGGGLGLGLAAGGAGGSVLGVGSYSGGGSSCLQLADVRTKLLAGTFVLQGLQHVFCAWGAVHAVTASGTVFCYREIDLASQLEALLRRSLHKLALDVARAWGPGAADEATLANIHQRWGDHLYGKGEYDAAMTQYLETVGQLEPSYVIRRFLDAQRIHNLTAYLELMHERGLATCDHTTLLLNCYTKLKDVTKLEDFIARGGRVHSAVPQRITAAAAAAGGSSSGGSAGPDANGTGGGGPFAVPASDPSRARGLRRKLTSAKRAAAAAEAERAAAALTAGAGAGRKKQQADAKAAAAASAPSLLYDPDTAIRVLRGAGYAEHALRVADAAEQIDSVLDILLDDLADADEAIAFLEQLPRRRRADALKKFGKALISLRAEAATGLIMDLCCGPPPGSQQPHGPHDAGPAAAAAVAGQALHHPPYLASVSDFAHLYSGEPTALMLLCEYILVTNTINSTAAAAATAAAVHGHQSGEDDDDGGGSGSAAAAARALAYERLLYHTLLELYLADNLWQQPGPQEAVPQQQPQASRPPALSDVQQPQQPSRHTLALPLATSSPAAMSAAAAAAAGAAPATGAALYGNPQDLTAMTGDPTARSHSQHAQHAQHPQQPQQPQHHHRSASAPPGPAPTTPAGPAPSPTSPTSLDVEARRIKALDLLARGWPPHVHLHDPNCSGSGHGAAGGGGGPAYDPDHALVLCRMHGFRKGLLFLYDRLRMPREVLQVYMSCGDHSGLISAVLKYGDVSRGGDPVLWSEVLEYFVAQHDKQPPASDCTPQIMQVVEHVERSSVLQPLVVLQSLSRSRRLPLSLVRGYMERVLQRDTAAVATDREAVARLAAETSALREEVTRMRTQPRLFQNSRCSASGAPLELPVIHFLCGHSYNLRQLGDNDRECPLCGPDQKRVAEIRASLTAACLQPERFFAELRQAADGFAVVAEHFGRGLMNATPAAGAAAAAAAAAAGPGAAQPGGLL